MCDPLTDLPTYLLPYKVIHGESVLYKKCSHCDILKEFIVILRPFKLGVPVPEVPRVPAAALQQQAGPRGKVLDVYYIMSTWTQYNGLKF